MTQPDVFAQAFVTELFTRDYRRSTRAELLSWAQYESAPLIAKQYPKADWSKFLIDALTDLSGENRTDTPIPADGPWLALHTGRAGGVRHKLTNAGDPPEVRDSEVRHDPNLRVALGE